MQARYQPPGILFNAHLETIYPALLRKVVLREYERERITTPDDDFLDLDWIKLGAQRLVIISHGLEGNTERAYVRGMARAFHQTGYDVLAWNYRGCSQEMNRRPRFYHSGATEDLRCVVNHVKSAYREISLIGFSLGGNLTLKFLGETGASLAGVMASAVVFSVPLDLHSSCLQLSQPSNRIYAWRFLRSLKSKIIAKSAMHPEIDLRGIGNIRTLPDFDNAYTAPLHGFANAIDYYHRCSSIHFIDHIRIPTLIINARNDPFLSKDCYPEDIGKSNRFVKAEYPHRGGHVGFTLFGQNGLYWSEQMALRFIQHPHD